MGLNKEDAKSFEDMAAEMESAETVETTETVAETTEEATEEVADETETETA